MKAIICVGEEIRDKQGDFVDILESQILNSLALVNRDDADKILLAYEPVWSIGAGGKKVTVEILEQSVFLIKKILKKKFKDNFSKVKIIYGGSVNEFNIKKLSEIFGVNGFLLGRSGLDSSVFTQMVKNLKNK
jgi:triosephosphate isomerase